MSTEDDIVVQANMTGIERRLLHDVLGRDEAGTEVPIAPPKTNGDTWIERNPAAIALLDQIEAACSERDAEMAEYAKAKPIADRASGKAMGHWRRVREANGRALRLREVLASLQKVVR